MWGVGDDREGPLVRVRAFHLPPCCVHLPLVLVPEGVLLHVEDSFDFLCYSRLVISIAPYRLSRDDHIYTETEIFG